MKKRNIINKIVVFVLCIIIPLAFTAACNTPANKILTQSINQNNGNNPKSDDYSYSNSTQSSTQGSTESTQNSLNKTDNNITKSNYATTYKTTTNNTKSNNTYIATTKSNYNKNSKIASTSKTQPITTKVSTTKPTTAPTTAARSTPPPFIHPSKIVVGYYGGWAAYSGYTPDKINASSLTVLNYAFAKIDSNLKIIVGDSYIDYSNFDKLKMLKAKNPNLRTVISVGGWNDSGLFSDVALTESSRSIFAESVVTFIKNYGFDGVDIDWEYPTGGGMSSNISRSVDKVNFGLLLKTLRNKLDTQGIKDNKHYILSFAGGASSTFASGIDLASISNYVDYGIIMTYDMHGGWDTYTDFNSPLYFPAGTSPQYKTSVDASVNLWLKYGFPANKLVMGVPFYGYVYKNVTNANNGLWQRYTSVSSAGYDTIKSKYLSSAEYTKYTHSTALVPWLFNGSIFITYDDENSVKLKAQYAINNKLLGVGIWDLSHDRNGILLNAVSGVLK